MAGRCFVQQIHPLAQYDISPEEHASSISRELPTVIIAMYGRTTTSWVEDYNDLTVKSTDRSAFDGHYKTELGTRKCHRCMRNPNRSMKNCGNGTDPTKCNC
jgi:hypothetical protein